MSLEIGTIFASLTGRVLVLEGNISPIANLVEYRDKITDCRRSTVPDLVEIPVPWMALEQVDLRGLLRQELSPCSLTESVFCFPQHLDTTTEDFRYFRQGRGTILKYSDGFQDVDVLALSGGPEAPPGGFKLYNLSFYSSFFYLDDESRQQAGSVIRGMCPKGHLVEFADKVSRSLGTFNAVHVRRGDFKRTLGKTTLMHTSKELIERLDNNFSRRDPLVLLTDEMEDPIFQDVRRSFPFHVFLDRYILDHFGTDFRCLPQNDPIALAFICQLVGSQSQDFIGSMTSTFTSLIQRRRGFNGREEKFKFLWNELPARGWELSKGNARPSEEIQLHPNGEMIRQFEGPYSWNCYHPSINPAWMREWPESFALLSSSRSVSPR